MLFFPRFFVISYCLLFFCSIQAVAAPAIPESSDTQKEKPFDWSKPAVSRGFGYEAGTTTVDQRVGQYKAGQVLYFFGEYNKAFKKWLPLAEQNYSEAQASIGWLYQAGMGVEKDIEKAIYYYRLAVKQNHATAQNNLGVLYEKGIGVDQDFQLARKLYKNSAEQGYRFAEFNYATFLLEGRGGERDRTQAIIWYGKAAAQDVLAAKAKLEELSK